MDGLRPMIPNYIQVGMMNCRAAKPLPQHLQDFLDGADENGAIFVSFGSVLTGNTVFITYQIKTQQPLKTFLKSKFTLLQKSESFSEEALKLNSFWKDEINCLCVLMYE